MWINAKERKPDTAHKVFVRGIDQKDNVDRVAIACWWDFDNGWRNFIIIDNEYHTPSFKEITHWMEITDILNLSVQQQQQEPTMEEHNKWYVPFDEIHRLKSVGYAVNHRAWGYDPQTVDKHSITLMACDTEMEAWYWCSMHYRDNDMIRRKIR